MRGEVDCQGREGGGDGLAMGEYLPTTQHTVWEICSALEWGREPDKKKPFTVGEWITHLAHRSLDQWCD